MEAADIIEFADFTATINDSLSSTPGVTVAPSASAHTKGSWVEVVASAAHDVHLITIVSYGTFVSGGRTTFLLDIGIGGAGSETVLIPNLIVGYAGSGVGMKHEYTFPLFIPAGTRISARCQANSNATSPKILLELYGNPKYPEQWRVGTKVVDYGTNTTTSGGTSINTGSSGSYGTYTDIAASTSDDHWYWAVGSQCNNSSSVSSQYFCYEFAVGAAAAERVFARKMLSISSAGPITSGPHPKTGICKHIPAGSRVSARGKCDTTSAHQNQFALYGVT